MKEVIFAKYNRGRKPEYQISTIICEENGVRFVEKNALTKEAETHIQNLKVYGEKLSSVYENLYFDIPEILNDGKTARFEYLQGVTEEDILKECFISKESLLRELHKYINLIVNVKEEQKTIFHENEQFNMLFGDGSSFCGQEAIRIANLDMIPENIIMVDNKMYCIDCEWVCFDVVPIRLIQFRALYYFYEKYKRDIIDIIDETSYWNSFGYYSDFIEICKRAEANFQSNISGRNNEYHYVQHYTKKVEAFDTIREKVVLYDVHTNRIDTLQCDVEERNIHIKKLDMHISELGTAIEKRDEELAVKNEELAVKNEELAIKINEIDTRNYEISQKNQLIHDKDVHIGNLENIIRSHEAAIHELSIPANKWRKLVHFLPLRAIRYVKRHIKMWWIERKENKQIIIEVPQFDSPKVSIVIPVYNQFQYTYNCIKSIIDTVQDIPYEIIIGDDESTDKTKKIAKIIRGVRVNVNHTDHGFLMNCNRASQLARGEYVLFLNNDTQVKEEWLSSLLELIESDDKIGMVGSKLIYPDGTLQEAGGIIWNDASGWNYGRNQDPDMPEYNYVREVDYISGASIMIRTSLWKELGGFDERFKPAYCEDSDLAFQVRKAGYKVMYQPKSVVVHFEGVSNGTDLDSGLKKYQVENSKKFKEKWKAELAKQFEPGLEPFLARERNHGRKVILIIDHYVPTFDKDAGSKTTIQYIRMFLKKGYIVKFIGDNYAQMEPYTTVLQQMGVEVLYGPWYAQHIFEWIDANKDYIDFAYLNRPHITEKYIDYLKKNTDIKLIYYGHDLHFLRTQREAEIEGSSEKLLESKMWREKELAIMKKASVSYYPSYVEEEAIHEIDSSIPVKAITAYVFDEFKEDYQYDCNKRQNIMFVGGFSHGPNIDAVHWFVDEIWTSIHEKTDAKFYIVGSNAPDDIKALDGDGIVFKGFVSDEELSKLYEECRMVVVPLRYGAGVKGKVVEAIYNGMPIVTTGVGAEGISGVDRVVKIEDNAKEFAKAVIELYTNEEELKSMALGTQSFIKDNFSIDAVWDVIKEDFR